MGIPEQVTDTNQEAQIPPSVAELSAESEAPEAEPYVISFAKYNDKMCEIEYLEKNKPKKALETIKKIGMKVTCVSDFQKFSIDRIPIARKGEYLKLYNRLSEDIELNEIKLQGTARIFYFDIESQKKFFIVAITENHLETNKVR